MKDCDYAKIKSVKPLYLIISEVGAYFEDKNGNKYLVFASADENEKVSKNALNFGMELKIKLR